jgi:hypothetical protein
MRVGPMTMWSTSPCPVVDAVQDPVRGRQRGQGVRDRLLTEDPPSEVLGIEDTARPRQAVQDEQEPERQEDRRPPPGAHQGENARDRDRRREDGDPQAQLRPQELGGSGHLCLIGRSAHPVKA